MNQAQTKQGEQQSKTVLFTLYFGRVGIVHCFGSLIVLRALNSSSLMYYFCTHLNGLNQGLALPRVWQYPPAAAKPIKGPHLIGGSSLISIENRRWSRRSYESANHLREVTTCLVVYDICPLRPYAQLSIHQRKKLQGGISLSSQASLLAHCLFWNLLVRSLKEGSHYHCENALPLALLLSSDTRI